MPLGEWVLREACLEAANWPRRMKVAVNLSPAQFKRRNLAPAVVRALAASALAREPARARDHRVRAAARERRDAGDAASACAGSACASRWTISAPAIRRSATCAASRSTRSRSTAPSCATSPRSEDCAAIVRAVAGLGASLGITTTAEGVETDRAARAGARPRLHRGPGLSLLPPAPGLRPARRLRRAGGARGGAERGLTVFRECGYSASGCFSGAASAKAGSVAHCASIASSVGQAERSLSTRRAFASCGMRQMSASVGSAPKQ